MTLLKLEPGEEGYAVSFPPQAESQAVDGGRSRYRLDVLTARPTVRVQWVTDEAGYDYLMAFHRAATGFGELPFTVPLIVDHGGTVEYTAYFLPGHPRLTGVAGDAYNVEAELEVIPLPVDSDFDEAVIMLAELYGEDGGALLDAIAAFANVTMPDDLG